VRWCPDDEFWPLLHTVFAASREQHISVRHSSIGRQPNFVALNRGCHLYSAWRPSCWALAHILVCSCKDFEYSGTLEEGNSFNIYGIQRHSLCFIHLYCDQAEKLLICEYCSCTFATEAMLKDHISTLHLGTVEHRCDECGKVMGSEMTLRIHRRQQHDLTCQRTCEACGLQFTRLDGLIQHLTSTHPHLLPEKYRYRLDELVCKQCNFMCSRRPALERHIEARHGGVPKYMCPMCARRFRCRRYVLRHLRIHHPAISAAKRSAMIVYTGNDESVPVPDVKSADDATAL